jgi:uncharacterized damage-inducible protein DinB
MSSPDLLQRMFAHMAWADTRTLGALRAMHEAPSQALDLYAHVLTAEHTWLRRIEGVTTTYDVFQSLGLDECERLARANHHGFATLLADGDRQRDVSYHTTTGLAHTTPLEDILVHVSHHGMYHRGQVALLMRAAGGTPVSTDYIVYFRDQRTV